MSQALRKLTGIVAKSKTALVFINQIREKIGVMFGSPETTTGGRALKFYSSMRIDVRRIGAIKEGEATIGNRTKLRVVKNKVAAPFRVAEFDILYGRGVSREGDLIDLGVAHKIVEKSGSWFSYGDLRLGQGRENSPRLPQGQPRARRRDRRTAARRTGPSLPPGRRTRAGRERGQRQGREEGRGGPRKRPSPTGPRPSRRAKPGPRPGGCTGLLSRGGPVDVDGPRGVCQDSAGFDPATCLGSSAGRARD